MDYISVKEAAVKFAISERRVQKLCECNRIRGAQMISNVWIIPATAEKPEDERTTFVPDTDLLSLKELCLILSISEATGRNWLKLGKLEASEIHKRKPFFSREYVEKLRKDIISGNNSALKKRRNKKYVSGSELYRDYISKQSANLSSAEKVVETVSSMENLSEGLLRIILAECAIQLLTQKYLIDYKGEYCLLEAYIKKEIDLGEYARLVDDLLENCHHIEDYIKKYTSLFRIHFTYENGEDILGLLYISCKNIASRKATGAYYTPSSVVQELVKNLFGEKSNYREKLTLDPCCGTGNFLLQLPSDIPVCNIYGNDIDEISVQLARINVALKYTYCKIDTLYHNITVSNYLHYQPTCFDFIIGNPPWGYDYDETQKEEYRTTFKCAIGSNIESYDLFIEHSFSKLNENGVLSFVLPESFLNVKAHQHVRALLMNKGSIPYISYLGNAFDKVQCPCIIIQILYNKKAFSTIGMNVVTQNSHFTINTERQVTPDFFSFTTTDTEYKVLEKVTMIQPCTFLKDRATFALGLVTGNNKKYISDTPGNGREIVLKGADICKYRKKESRNYVLFEPENFQQVAPIDYYRAPEKLLYRFICNQLVFAYDDKQTLSLNSCNILIPQIQELEIKYIMAVLNSRVAQFIFSKQFQSVKVLRSHIEQIPIPIIEGTQQRELIKIIDALIAGADEEVAKKFYDDIDAQIASLYGLNNSEYNIILRTLKDENIFLF